MSKKTKKTEPKHAAYIKVEYNTDDVEDMVGRLNATIDDRQELIKLIEIKKRAKKDLLEAELEVMSYCILSWWKTIRTCEKEIKRLKAKAK